MKKTAEIITLIIFIAGIFILSIFYFNKTDINSNSSHKNSSKVSSSESGSSKTDQGNTNGEQNYNQNNSNGESPYIAPHKDVVENDLNSDEITINDDTFIAQLDSVFSNLDSYIGKKITVEGFVGYKQGNDFSVLRYFDMQHGGHYDTVTVGIDANYEGGIPDENAWVVVQGTIDKVEYDGKAQPVVKVSSIEKKSERGQEKVTG